tara:strand:+ start:3498 stop:4298 length:801 start_codon:yes stop_codon:yes gene_type:complete
MKILVYISDFLSLIRHWHWQTNFYTNIAALLLLLLVTGAIQTQEVFVFIYIVHLYILYAGVFLVNNFADSEEDAHVGKENNFDVFPRAFTLPLMVVLVLLGFFISFLYDSRAIVFLTGVILFFALFYSLPPIRFKKRGFLGPLTSSVSQRLPFLFFYFLIPNSASVFWYLFGWLIITSFIIEIGFQLADSANDIQNRTQTYVIVIGVEKTVLVLKSLILFLFAYLAMAFFIGFPYVFLVSLILFLFSQGVLNDARCNIAHVGTQKN